jgi:hypothetical protein
MLLSSYLGCALKKRCGTLLLHTTLRAGQTCLAPLLRTVFRPDMINLINVFIREYNYVIASTLCVGIVVSASLHGQTSQHRTAQRLRRRSIKSK